MIKTKISEKANSELLKSRYPDQAFIDDVLSCLKRAEGIAEFIADATCLEQAANGYHEINTESLWRTVQAIELEIKDAIIMVNDYWYRNIEDGVHSQNNVKKRTFSELMAEDNGHG